MNNYTTTKNYANYEIEIIFSESWMDYSFIIKDESNKVVMKSSRTYDDAEDAYVRACTRINDEL